MPGSEAHDEYMRGRFEAATTKTLEDHRRRIEGTEGDVSHLADATDDLKSELGALSANIAQREAVSHALEDAVERSASKQITARQLYLALGGFLVGLGGLVVTVVLALGGVH